MANTLYHGENMVLYMGTPANSSANINLSSDLMEANVPLTQDLGDVTTGGSVGKRWYPCLQGGAGSFKLTADGNANMSWAVLANYAAVQSATPANYYSFVFGPGGNASGAPKVSGNIRIKNATLPVKTADVVEMTVAWEFDNGYTVSTF